MGSTPTTGADPTKKSEIEEPPEIEESLPPLEFTRDNVQWLLLTAITILYSAYHVSYGYAYFVNTSQHTMISVCLSILVITQLIEVDLDTTKGKAIFGARMLMSVVIIYITYYFVSEYYEFTSNVLSFSVIDYVLATVLLFTVMGYTYYQFGKFVTATAIASIVYAMAGSYLPGPFRHSSIAFDRVLQQSVLIFDVGVFGFLPNVGAVWIVIFLIYASVLIEFGALQLAIDTGRTFNEKFHSGVPQLAVVSSFVMGSISGSAAANTATTGAVTIPLMKKYGIDGETAAAIEANASSGGQVLPPVMGASAFVMASFLEISYLAVIIAALLPALLFYLINAVNTYYIAKEYDLVETGGGSDESLATRHAANQPLYIYFPLLGSVLLLIYDLGVVQIGPLSAGFHALMALLALQFVWQMIFANDRTDAARGYVVDLLHGFHKGAITSAAIMIVICAIGVFVSMLGTGNITQVITFTMLDISGGMLLVLLLLAAFLSILFGMGMPTVAAYVVVSVFVVPAVTEFGIAEINAHIFLFYLAILSAITPPVALAALVASSIAGADFFQTAKKAMILGIPMFILPFTVIYQPSLAVWTSETPFVFGYMIVVFVGMITVIHFNVSANRYVEWSVKLVALAAFTAATFWGGTTVLVAAFVAAVLVIAAYHAIEYEIFGSPSPT